MFRNSSLFVFVLLMIFIPAALNAQDTALFIQQLSWTPDEYALRYEIEIEEEDAGVYRRLHVLSTESPPIIIYLPQGNYRYRVTPYNLLNRPDIASEWLDFEIIPIFTPEISSNTEEDDIEDEQEILQEDPRQIFNVFLGVSWLTHINIHGQADWMSASGQYLSGAAFRLGLVSSNLSFFNLGLEIVPAWYSIDALFNEDKKAVQSLLLECNFILQKEFFNRKAALVLRAGAGFNLSFSETPVESNETALYANSGLSFIWLPVQSFYLEVGVNYSYLFAIENPTGLLRPFVGGGVRLASH